ncbi:outer membrane lipoprotein-sorting protein [Morganella morganii]|uniref:outer membrane lipoprotein-sorting protein n=1 Tax=Morganella morganii TaxID=582 RepID=UPI001F17E4CB|nr:outer membrane lipoprotein-sorting protein [Morganella morganii]MCF1266441.1 outer membrane lipoprotein-sorting protein [Morganella morganii]
MTANRVADYSASLVAEETIKDGDKQDRDCYRLHLTATNPDAAHPAMELWGDKTNFKSHKAE